MPPILNANAVMMCPHGGQVKAIPSNVTILVGGAPVLVMTDVFTIVGCTIVPPVGSPCLMVQWMMGAVVAKAKMVPILLQSSVGLCVGGTIPGPPIIVFPGQMTVQGI